MAKSGKRKSKEQRITLIKTPLGALVYSFKKKPSRLVNWEVNLSFESSRSETRARKPSAAKKKEAPKEETPSA